MNAAMAFSARRRSTFSIPPPSISSKIPISAHAFICRSDFYDYLLELNPQAQLFSPAFPESLKAVTDGVRFPDQSDLDLRALRRATDSSPGIVRAVRAAPCSFSAVIPFCRALETLSDLGTAGWETVSSVLLSAYVIWLSGKSDDDLAILIDSFIIAHEHLCESTDFHLRSLLDSGFYFLFKRHAVRAPAAVAEKLVLRLIRFFMATPIMPFQFYQLFLFLLPRSVIVDGQALSTRALEVFSFLQILKATYAVPFEPSFVARVCRAIFPGMMILDSAAFLVFADFAAAIPAESIDDYMAAVAGKLSAAVHLDAPTIVVEFPTIERNPILRPQIFEMAFPSLIDFDRAIAFPDVIPLSSLFSIDRAHLLVAFRRLFRAVPRVCLTFLTTFTSTIDLSFDGIAFALALIQGQPDAVQCLPLLYNSVLFDERLTVFDPENGSLQTVLSLRRVAMEILQECDGKALPAFAAAMKSRPLIFAEFLHFLVHTGVASWLGNDLRYPLVSEVINAAIFCRAQKSGFPGIEHVLASIFVLLARLFIQPDFSQFFFDD
jgi:hypothetical protein